MRRRLRSCSRLLDERVEAAQLDEREHDVVEAAGQAAHEECDEVHERASLKVQPDAADQRDEDEVVDPVVLSRQSAGGGVGRKRMPGGRDADSLAARRTTEQEKKAR